MSFLSMKFRMWRERQQQSTDFRLVCDGFFSGESYCKHLSFLFLPQIINDLLNEYKTEKKRTDTPNTAFYESKLVRAHAAFVWPPLKVVFPEFDRFLPILWKHSFRNCSHDCRCHRHRCHCFHIRLIVFWVPSAAFFGHSTNWKMSTFWLKQPLNLTLNRNDLPKHPQKKHLRETCNKLIKLFCCLSLD